jgi:hypothetical protein
VTLHPDAALTDADWIKGATWDLERDPEWWRTQATEEAIRTVAELPAFAAAPQAVADAIQERLAEVAD